MNKTKSAFAGTVTVRRVVGWLRRILKRPCYVIGRDMGKGRDYWVKTRINSDGKLEIVDHGENEHMTANAKSQRPNGAARKERYEVSLLLRGLPEMRETHIVA